MAKRFVPAALGLVYVALAAWVVHLQADSYRRSLRERRAVRLASATRTHPGIVSTPRVDRVPAAIGPDDPRAPKTAGTPVVVNTPTRVPEPARPSPAPAPYESPVKLQPLVIDGLENATTADEAMFGEALNALILINHPAVEDGSSQQRAILEATRPLIELRERKDVEVKITVLDSVEVNAFSHMGGYLYVTRGLLSFAGTDEEFRFVVGHELAHVDKRHGQELVAALTRDGTIARVGTLQAMYHQIAAGYTEAQEFAADDRVIDQMLELGHTTRECLMYLRKLRRLSEELNSREGRKPPRTPPASTVQDLANHVRSQPAAWKRLARLETRLNATPARPGAVGPAPTGR